MRALFLSLAAVCALLGDASPVDKRQPGLINGDVSQVSTTSTGLAKRLSVIEGNTVTINGVVVPPGTELAGGIFIEGPNTPICYAYCLNPRLPVSPVNYRAKCAAQGCPNSVSTTQPKFTTFSGSKRSVGLIVFGETFRPLTQTPFTFLKTAKPATKETGSSLARTVKSAPISDAF